MFVLLNAFIRLKAIKNMQPSKSLPKTHITMLLHKLEATNFAPDNSCQ